MRKSGEQNRGWRRSGWHNSLACGGILLLASLLVFRGSVSDVCWGLSHGWTMSHGSGSFRVPFGWRPEELPPGQRGIVLRNRLRVWPGRVPDRIQIYEAQEPFDAEEMAVRWQRLETPRMTPGDRLEPTPADAFLRDKYRCTDVLRSRDGRVNVTCFDRAGRWVGTLRGDEGEILDLSKTLRSLAAIGPQ